MLTDSQLIAYQIKKMNTSYIADHINRIATRYANNPAGQLDSKWRIASNAELFDDLKPNGTLTPAQEKAVDEFILEFSSMPQGSQLIESFNQRGSLV